MDDQRFITRALELSASARHTPGTEPFGAVVVLEGRIVGEGLNHSAAHFDPTSHGEIEAIRDACRRLRRVELAGCELYSSCEPCALCLAAMHIVGMRRLVYAALLDDANDALAALPPTQRPRVDVHVLRAVAGQPAGRGGTMAVEQQGADEAMRILREWAGAQDLRGV